MLDRLEELRRRFLALLGLTQDDPRRFIVASVIVYIAGAVAIVMTLLLREPADEPDPPPREIPQGSLPGDTSS